MLATVFNGSKRGSKKHTSRRVWQVIGRICWARRRAVVGAERTTNPEALSRKRNVW